jgi:hypothetical protein
LGITELYACQIVEVGEHVSGRATRPGGGRSWSRRTASEGARRPYGGNAVA